MSFQYMQADIYFHTDKSREYIAQDLARLLQAELDSLFTIKGNQYTIYLKRNKGGSDYRDPIQFSNFNDFCYYLDYSPREDLCEQISLDTVTKILEFFWQNNIPAVAACEYSEELPLDGGYSREAPWPN